jgi:hypothetical protein
MKTFIVTIITLVVLGFAGSELAVSNPPGYNKKCIVKLYSGSTVVGTWEALNFGQVEGETLVFTIGNDINPKKVRISGPWSVEEKE